MGAKLAEQSANVRPCWRHIQLEKNLPTRIFTRVSVVAITLFGVHKKINGQLEGRCEGEYIR